VVQAGAVKGEILLVARAVFMALREQREIPVIPVQQVVPALQVLRATPRPAYHKHFPVVQQVMEALVVMEALGVQGAQGPAVLGG